MQMIIGGRKTNSSDNRFMESVNPATNEVLGTYPCATKEDVERALECALTGKKVWGEMSFNSRADILRKAADIFEKHVDELAELQCREMGRPFASCIGEAMEPASHLRSSVAAGTHMLGEVYPNKDAGGSLGDLAMSLIEPLGVVVCIVPFNFPVGTLSFKVAPALAAGNAVIIKAPSDACLTVLRYTEILLEAGFPDNVVQVISGPGGTIGDWLVDTDKVNAISFTGSTEIGVGILRKSARYLHKTILELGGNDPLIICEDALDRMDYAVDQAMTRTFNAGQICCINKRFLVHNSIKPKFIKMLTESLSGLKIGNPLDPEVDMGPCISEKAAKTIESQVNQTISQGARLIYGGRRDGAFYYPAVIDDVTRDMDIAKDMEVFGPVFPVIGFDSDEEAIEIANQTSYGLNGGIISGDIIRGIRIALKIEAGTVVTNGSSQWRRDIAPFGGYKMSGMGREGIKDLMEEFTQKKTIVIKGI